jgi:hypothetical protein
MTKESIVPQTIKLNNAYAPGLIIKGALSQSANLQEWQNSSGDLLAAIRNDGVLRVSQIISKENYSSYFSFASGSPIQANPLTTGTVGLIVKGVASQTANLQEWQNSAGSVLAKVTASGEIRTENALTAYGNAYLGGGLGVSGQYGADQTMIVYAANPSLRGLVVQGYASQTADIQTWQNSSGTVLTKIESGGAVNISPTSTPNGYSLYLIGAGSSGIVTMKSTATSAHAIQLQNSANTVVFKMDLEGRIVPSSASSTGLVVRGAASQTANLQEWQNSSGTVLGRVDNYGALYLSETVQIGPGVTDQRIAGGGLTIIHRGGTGSITFGIKAIASQTGDLTQWQNSAGTVLAKVDTYGYITSNGAILPSGNGSFESAYGGAFMAMKKVTSAVANPVADVARMYLVAGTNAGTLKLVIKAGAAGAETTILDNIPQS